MEKWLPIVGFEKHHVSDHGRVKTFWRCPEGRIMSQHKDQDGYPVVDLHKDGKQHHTLRIHKLVMLTFVGPRPQGQQVDHKNHDKTDNRLVNLHYVTLAENLRRKYEAGRCAKGEANGGAKFKPQDVLLWRELVSLGYHQKDISWLFGVSETQLSSIIRRESWRHI